MSGIPDAQASFQEHNERFAAFLNNTNQKQVELDAVVQGMQTVVPEVWERAVNLSESAFRLYFMGAGNGAIELPLTQQMVVARGNDDLEVFCEDPSPQMSEEFFARAGDLALGELVKEYSVMPFQDPRYSPPKADFALSSHVWYYVDAWRGRSGPANSLVKFANVTQERSGAGLVIVQSGTSDRHRLSTHYLSLIGSGEAELAGEELANTLQHEGVPVIPLICEAVTNVSSCFNDGIFMPNEEGKHLLSFLLRTDWAALDPEVQQKVANELCQITEENGSLEMRFRDLFVWLKSSPVA